MNFLFPEFLWALTILAIPIVIHLFNFKKYKTLYFSSVKFIKHVDQQTKSTQRLKHILVLISRLLAFIFLVLAFAQPYFTDKETDKGVKNAITSFYVDNSFSMQARGPEGELLSEAREKAKEIIEDAPVDAQFLIVTNEMSGRERRLLNKIEAFEKLDEIQLSPLSRSLEEVINWQQEALKSIRLENDYTSPVNSFVFSDFQKSNDKPFKKGDFEDTYYPTRLIPEQAYNVYIDSVWFTSPVHKAGRKNELNIQVVNQSEELIENLEVEIRIGDYTNTIFIDATPMKKTSTVVSYSDKKTGFVRGEVTVVDEHVFFDDTYYLSYEVQNNTNVLIIDGEDAIEGTSLIYELDDYYISKKTSISSITKEDFSGQDLVVLNGANAMSSGVASYIAEFVNAGGSALLFPGKSPAKGSWNQLLRDLKLPTLGNSVNSGNRIKTLNYTDPFYDGVFEEEKKELNLPSVSSTYQALKGNSQARDLIQLQNGLSLFSYNSIGGNAFMFYGSVHPDNGTISRDALFTTLLLRSAELSERKRPLSLQIGSSSTFPVYKPVGNDEPIHITSKTLDLIPQRTESAGVSYLSLNKIDNYNQLLAGNYSIQTDKQLGDLSLNYNRSESDLNYYTEEEINNLFTAFDFKYNEISSNSELSTLDIDKPFSYWKLCIVLTLIFVAIEMMLVRLLK